MVNFYKSYFFKNVWDAAFAQAFLYWKRNHILAKSKIKFLSNNSPDIFNSRMSYLKETSRTKYLFLSTVQICSSRKKFIGCNSFCQKVCKISIKFLSEVNTSVKRFSSIFFQCIYTIIKCTGNYFFNNMLLWTVALILSKPNTHY